MSKSLSEDAFFNGTIRIRQHKNGYRFSIDAVILAWHVQPAPGAKVVDLGTGCGIIPLILAFRHPKITVAGLEVQPRLAAIARENVRANQMDDRIAIVQADFRMQPGPVGAGAVDVVVCNPPFRKKASGRINPDRERAVARHEIKATIGDVTSAAAGLLRVGGEFAAVYPASRLTDILIEMRRTEIEPRRLRLIHSRSEAEAKLVLVMGNKKSSGALFVDPPLILYQPDGSYTEEAQQMFSPDTA